MSKLYINNNGVQVPVAELALISAKEQMVLGNLERDLILRTAGNIKIQVGNKFYDLTYTTDGSDVSIGSGSAVINILENNIQLLSQSVPKEGTMIYVKESKTFYITTDGVYVAINQASGSSTGTAKMYLQCEDYQELSGDQKFVVSLNAGLIISSLNEVSKLSSSKVYSKQIIFSLAEGKHYQLKDVNNPGVKESWKELYLSLASGGKVAGNVMIDIEDTEDTSSASLHIVGAWGDTSLRKDYSDQFNGLFIGDKNFEKGLAVWTDLNNNVILSSQRNSASTGFKFITNGSGTNPLTTLYINNGKVGVGGDTESLYLLTVHGQSSFKNKASFTQGLASPAFVASASGFNIGLDGNREWTSEFDNYIVRKKLTTPLFLSGFSGSGVQLDAQTASLTVDNLTVRKQMQVYELLIQQIRASNGSVWVSDAVKIYEVIEYVDKWRCEIDTDGGIVMQPFAVNDIVRCQKWTGRDIKYYTAQVIEIGPDGSWFALGRPNLEGGAFPAVGDDLVRIGNATTLNRQGALYLTASDNHAPYIDVLDGVNSASFSNKVKVRMGKLSGIFDTALGGQLSGYGLYANNVYLKGKLVITYNGEDKNLSDLDAISFGSPIEKYKLGTTIMEGAYINTGLLDVDQIRVNGGMPLAEDVTEQIGVVSGQANLAQQTANTAVQDAADAASLIDQILSDSVITTEEKLELKLERDKAFAERFLITGQADLYNITTEKDNYLEAYTTMYNLLEPLFLDMNIVSEGVDTAAIRAGIIDYHTKKIDLLKLVVENAKDVADAQALQLSEVEDITNNFGTDINGGLITSTVIRLGNGITSKAGISGYGETDDSIRIWAGSTFDNRALAPFRVDNAGNAWMTNANITGHIEATSGKIGGMEVSSFGEFGLVGSKVRVELEKGLHTSGYLSIPQAVPIAPITGEVYLWVQDGTGSGTPITISGLDDLSDVLISNPMEDQLLVYKAGLWKNHSISSFAPSQHTHLLADITDFNTYKNVANGIVGLDANAKIDVNLLPPILTTETDYGLIGTLNGINKDFTTRYSFRTGSTRVYVHGLRMFLGQDYTEISNNTIRFTTAPEAEENLICDYDKN